MQFNAIARLESLSTIGINTTSRNAKLMDATEYYDAKYIRERFRMSESTLYRSIKNNRFPEPIRYGKDRLWPKSVIEEFESRIIELARRSYKVALHA